MLRVEVPELEGIFSAYRRFHDTCDLCGDAL